MRTRAALVQWNLAHLNSVALTPRRCTTLSGAQAGCSPLHFAAKNDHVAVTRLLLERGADKDARSDVRASKKSPHPFAYCLGADDSLLCGRRLA